MQYFVGPLRPGQQTTQSLRAHQYKPPRKRKRNEDAGDDPISSDEDAEHPLASPNTQPYATPNTLETAQLRVAGLLLEDAATFEIPSKPFPHAPARAPRDSLTSSKLQQALAGLDPPLFAANAISAGDPVARPSDVPALRHTHLNVMTTLMHRCLLEGDYQRAGRAWGMILRSHIAGAPIDPRTHGRWGIGAELLLRRNTKTQIAQVESTSVDVQLAGSPSAPGEIFTEEGFELAREYYERLIVQHPTRKQYRHAIDARTFYPAMFSLWIYEVCERIKRMQSESERTFDDLLDISSEDIRAQQSAIRAEELHQAREIADRQDQVIVSPPFDKHAELLQLRGMVGLWIGDLVLGEGSSLDGDDWGTVTAEEDEGKETATTQEKVQQYIDSRREFQRAQEFLQRARTYGRPLTDSIAGVEAKIRDLTKKLERMTS